MIRSRWTDWVASVEDGWNLLSSCTDQIFVMGLSMGGMLSLLFAAHNPVVGIVVMASPHHLPNDPRLRFVKPLSIIQPYMPKGESDWVDEEAYSNHVCYPKDPTRAYAELPGLFEAMQAGLPSVSAPILLIYSRDDQTVLAKDGHMDQVYASVGSRDKDKLWIDKSGHVLTRDAQRETVFKACADFVDRISTKTK
jgi:carboxylesterase